MPETTTQTLFNTTAPNTGPAVWGWTVNPLAASIGGADISQNEKDAIMRQIHPIFLTAHSEDKTPLQQSNFDKFLGFMRLCLEGLLKLVDILVDAVIQVARLSVWIVAITGVLIVVTLMTNTTDKFIDLLNESIFKAFWWETRIEKVPSLNNPNPITIPGLPGLKSETTDDTGTTTEVETVQGENTEIPTPRSRRRVATPVETGEENI